MPKQLRTFITWLKGIGDLERKARSLMLKGRFRNLLIFCKLTENTITSRLINRITKQEAYKIELRVKINQV